MTIETERSLQELLAKAKVIRSRLECLQDAQGLLTANKGEEMAVVSVRSGKELFRIGGDMLREGLRLLAVNIKTEYEELGTESEET